MRFNLSNLLTDDELRLLKRCGELFSRAESGVASISHFLNARERFIIEQMSPTIFSEDESEPICFFWGGYPDAERSLLCCLPAYYRYSLTEGTGVQTICREELSAALMPIRIKTSGYVKLAHRDFLGALVGLGIERTCLGDILTDGDGATVFISPTVEGLIKNELTYIGRDKVKVSDITLSEDFNYSRNFEALRGTVASPRLDAVVSELARTSRETAKSLITEGLVEHNHFTAGECDSTVSSGDIISVKKKSGTKGGKFIVDSLDERSQKGRVILLARRYV